MNLPDGSLKQVSLSEFWTILSTLTRRVFGYGRAQQSCLYPEQVASFSLVEPLTSIVIRCWMATFVARLLNDIIIEVYFEVVKDVTCLERKL